MAFSYVNGAPPKETPLIDERGRVTAPWFAYLVGLQRSNSGVVIGAGGLDVDGATITGDATFTGAVLFGGGVSFTNAAAARLALGLGSASTHSALDFDPAGAAAAASAASLQKSSNLSDVANAATARSNLGLGSAATQPSSAFDTAGAAAAAQAASLQKSSNLSDVANAATARSNLGLGSAATQPSSAFDTAGAAATAQAAAIAASDPLGSAATAQAAAIAASDTAGAAAAAQAASLQKSSNLSDVANAATARSNLGLGSAALNNTADFDAAGVAAAAVAAIPTAGTATTGLLSATNWNTFNGKQAALGYTPLNPANNLSEVTAATARSNLGVPGLAVSNTFTGSQTFSNTNSVLLTATGNLNTGFGGWSLFADGTPFLSGRTYGSTTATALGGITLTNWSVIYHNLGSGLLIQTANATPLVFGTNNGERARFSSAGRLSIGSTSDNGTDAVQITGSLIASTQVKTAGLVTGLRTVTAADTATTSDHTILGNISGAVTETLPAAPLTGQEFYLCNVGSAVWTISGNGKNIWAAGVSAASITLAANASAILKYDGTVWRRIV